MIYPGEGKKGEPKAGDYVLAAEQTRAEAAASPHRSTAVDLARADKWEGQARTKQLPSTRTEIGAGGELIDIEDRWDALGVVDTVADPDYVTASASRERLELANEAGSLDLALDAADSIQAQDSLEKMLVHEMAVLHRGMMRAARRMNEELYAATGRDEGRREAANVRACRLAGAISRLSATYQQGLLTLQRKRTGGKPARHCEAHSPAGECHRRRASRGRGRHGNEGPGGSDGAGDDRKMNNEPLEREPMNNEPLAREPIDRVRARLQALLKANAAPRCGARSKRTGKPCRGAAMPNGRCKLHGGKSTGPRTMEGLERSRRANWKHGHFSREAKAQRSRLRAAILTLRDLCGSI